MDTNNFKDINEISSDIMANVPNVEKIILFGSAVISRMYNDIDLLIVYKNTLDLGLLNKACADIKKRQDYNFVIEHVFDYGPGLKLKNKIHLLYANKDELFCDHPIIDNIKKGRAKTIPYNRI